MRVRRCAHLMFEPREQMIFDLDSLAAGGDGLRAEHSLVALVPHRQNEAGVTAADIALLAAIPLSSWTDWSELARSHCESDLHRLLDAGILIADDEAHANDCKRDQRLRDDYWHTPSAACHFAGCWNGVRSGDDAERAGYATMQELIGKFGEPPEAEPTKLDAAECTALPEPQSSAFDTLLRRRATCRNFDPGAALSLDAFATILHRVFGAQGTLRLEGSGATTIVKRNSPSGGGLHPTDAYLLVQRVNGLAPGLYRYLPIAHALELLQRLDPASLADLALRSVAGQTYFANAPALVAMTARFGRSFWKYRNHAKAYRVTALDIGHLSQTMYLAATDLGLGAFVTAAINEIEIEQALQLDTPAESVLAICGFGARATTRERYEFDPAHQVWNEQGERID